MSIQTLQARIRGLAQSVEGAANGAQALVDQDVNSDDVAVAAVMNAVTALRDLAGNLGRVADSLTEGSNG